MHDPIPASLPTYLPGVQTTSSDVEGREGKRREGIRSDQIRKEGKEDFRSKTSEGAQDDLEGREGKGGGRSDPVG